MEAYQGVKDRLESVAGGMGHTRTNNHGDRNRTLLTEAKTGKRKEWRRTNATVIIVIL